MRYEHILRAFYGSPWAIQPEVLTRLQLILHGRSAGEVGNDADLVGAINDRRARLLSLYVSVNGRMPDEAEFEAMQARRGSLRYAGKVAVIPCYGVLAQRMGLMEESSGGTSTEAIGAALDEALADKSVRSICLAIDSPGGSVFGVEELAKKLMSARDQKKCVAVADSLAASAAYWIGSQASELYVTPGGMVGSIGVLTAHDDMSGYFEQAGVKTTLVSAGKYKTEANPYGPLDDDARASMQAQVDTYYAMFTAAVARGRGVSEATVRNGYGQGRVLTAKDAKAAGMVDGIKTLEKALRDLGGDSSGDGSRSVAMLDRKLRLEEEV